MLSNQEAAAPLIAIPPPGRNEVSSSPEQQQVHVIFQNNVISEEYRLKVALVTQWTFAVVFLILFIINILVAPPWYCAAGCDPFQTSWSFIWSSLTLLHVICLLAITHIRFAGGQPPRALYHAQRGLRLLNLTWFISGVKPLFWDAPCNSASVRLGRLLWWAQASCFLLPLCCYISLCLSFPCLLLLLRHLHEPSANETPTPHSVINKLEVRKYDELLETLRAEYGQRVEFFPTPSLSEVVRQNPVVEALTTAATAAIGVHSLESARPRTEGQGLEEDSMPQSHQPIAQRVQHDRLVVGKTCPVCLAEFDSGDSVMLMPCDKRHFFHVDCVVQWLKTSQVCPICRSNIVTLANANGQSPSNRNDDNDNSSNSGLRPRSNSQDSHSLLECTGPGVSTLLLPPPV